jgi:D-alanyl-D-alanine carboxypeptidase
VKDPRGFGLGVAQVTNAQTGTIWYYEGETLGYRVLYGYFPKQDAVIVLATNSQPKGKDDHIGPLLARVYDTMVRLKAF